MIVEITLWWSDIPVSRIFVFIKVGLKFVSKRLIQLRLFLFLKQVGPMFKDVSTMCKCIHKLTHNWITETSELQKKIKNVRKFSLAAGHSYCQVPRRARIGVAQKNLLWNNGGMKLFKLIHWGVKFFLWKLQVYLFGWYAKK